MIGERRVHSTIPVSDVDRAGAWYEEKLGVRLVTTLPSGRMYEAAAGTRFVLFPSPNAGASPNTLMGFDTPDIASDVRELKSRGVTFEEYDTPGFATVDSIATRGPIRSAWFRDPDGNILGVVQLPE